MSTPASASTGSLRGKARIIVVSRIVTILAQTLGMVILARALSKEDFGTLSFALLAYSTILALAQLGLPESVFYFFEKIPKTAQRSLALRTAKTLFFLSLAGAALLMGLGWITSARQGFEAVPSLIWPLMILLCLELPSLSLPNVLIAIDRVHEAAWINVFLGITQFLALTVPVLLGKPIVYVVYSLLGYGLLRFLVSAGLFFRNFRDAGQDTPPGMMKDQLRYSIPLSLAQILWNVNRQLDKYVVQALLPAAVFAEYIVGAWEIPVIPTIAYSVASVMMPRFVSLYSKNQIQPLVHLWHSAIKKVSVVLIPIIVLLLLVAEEFIILLFSEKYVAAAIPFRIYTLILLHRVASYTSLLRAVGDTRTITTSAMLLFGVNAALSVPLALWMGVSGPPTATLVANIVSLWYILKKIQGALNIRLREVFPFGFYGRTLLIAGLCAAPALVIGVNPVETPLTGIVIKSAVFLGLFGTVMTLTGVWRKEDWKSLIK